MTSKQPIITQISNVAVLIHIVAYILILTILYFLGIDGYFMIGSFLYILAMIMPRKLIAKNHRKGIRYFKEKNYEAAIQEFEKSYEYFKKYKWIDKYRVFTLFSGSSISYSEMALLNIAFCSGQIGNGKKSKETYEKVLLEFPDNEIAKSTLRLLQSIENKEMNNHD
jgi:tetratricopeptide (TPR) repeat protein